MTRIKFGTDGWRAIIAKDFTVDNVARVAVATAEWLKRSHLPKKVVIGYDCRFGGKMFAETVATVLAHDGLEVLLSEKEVTTPMVSLAVMKKEAGLGVIITASHNPPEYNGFKLKGSYGGPLLPEKVEEIEALIQEEHGLQLDDLSLEKFKQEGLIKLIDLETMYCDHVAANFDLDAIRKSGLKIAYDAMYGAGQDAVKRLLPDATRMHCEKNPSFYGVAPEPIHKNLQPFSDLIAESGNFAFGFATDGDADRIGVYDAKGRFVDSHHVILLLIKYLFEQKNFKGTVCTAFSTSVRIGKLCKHFGLENKVVKIGFKYICGVMLKEDVLLGGEESGGIAIKGHIPERDGIWIGLTILEYMVKTGKTLAQLIDDVYAIVGPFAYERADLHINEKLKEKVIASCRGNDIRKFGDFAVSKMEDLDGFKFFIGDDEWLMIRPSGTEPVLRTYAESSTSERAREILKAGYDTLIA
ncbi:MAG: phosphoglucomutase/phosphomannomutase family protein [Flavobacteriales bacterium]|nr:phosphoglucomutase/phosphomannomutase family protein [Flavobacteriales bacterium]MCB9448197.1 phosphoglucomutase/phosphomannomutase family protein [Flavobacteriales bacterium]